jgi:hypothetical protein
MRSCKQADKHMSSFKNTLNQLRRKWTIGLKIVLGVLIIVMILVGVFFVFMARVAKAYFSWGCFWARIFKNLHSETINNYVLGFLVELQLCCFDRVGRKKGSSQAKYKLIAVILRPKIVAIFRCDGFEIFLL